MKDAVFNFFSIACEKLHNFGQLIIKLEIDNQNISSLMIGKTRTMWNLVANRCTQYFQNKFEPSDDELIAYDKPYVIAMYASQLIAYDLTHIFTLLRAPYSQVVNSFCALYTSVYSMELWKHLQHLTVLASKKRIKGFIKLCLLSF